MARSEDPYSTLATPEWQPPDMYADVDRIAERYIVQGYNEDLAFEIAYAKCEQKEVYQQ